MRSLSRLSSVLFSAALAAGVLAACSAGAGASPSSAAAATQNLPPFAIRTAAQQPQACMDALLGGKLMRNAMSGLGVTSADGQANVVEWPFRYSARTNNGRIELLDETGAVVAREGDEITLGGGFGNQFWHACAPVAVSKAGG